MTEAVTSNPYDEKPITAKGEYDLANAETDITFEEDLEEKHIAVEDQVNLAKVMNLFQGFLEQKFKSQKSTVSNNSQTTANSGEECKETFRADQDDAMAKKKIELKEKMGPSVYAFYYEFLYAARTNP